MPSTHTQRHPLRHTPTQGAPSHVERQKQQQSHMVREQPDDTPHDQRVRRSPWGGRQMA